MTATLVVLALFGWCGCWLAVADGFAWKAKAQHWFSEHGKMETDRDAWKRRAYPGPLTDSQAKKILGAVFREVDGVFAATPSNPIVLPELAGGVRPFGDFALYSELHALIGGATASEGDES